MRTSGAAGGPSDVQGVRDKYFLEPSVPIGELDEGRDDRVPTKLPPQPQRGEWRGWIPNGEGPRTNRDAFEAQWAERGGERSDQRAPNRPSSPGSGSESSSDADPERIVQIACGWDEVLALKANGEVWLADALNPSWAFLSHFSRPDNYDIRMRLSTLAVFAASDPWPQLGTHYGSRGTNPHPPHAMWLGPRPSERVVHLAMGRDHCVVLSEAGKVYSWGSAERSLLGRPAGGTDVSAARVWFHDDWVGGREEPFIIDVCGSAALALGDGCPPRRRGTGTGTATPRASIPQASARRGLRARLYQMLW